jgi:hypothetical protein
MQNDHSKSAVTSCGGKVDVSGVQLKYDNQIEPNTKSVGASGSGVMACWRVSQCVQLIETHLGAR